MNTNEPRRCELCGTLTTDWQRLGGGQAVCRSRAACIAALARQLETNRARTRRIFGKKEKK